MILVEQMVRAGASEAGDRGSRPRGVAQIAIGRARYRYVRAAD